MNPIRSIIRSATRKKEESLNILSFVTHERFQPNIARTEHNFFVIQGNGKNNVRNWNNKVSPIPKNFNILPKDFQQLPLDLNIDVILSDNRLVHLDLAKQIRGSAKIPIVNTEHCFPPTNWSENVLLQIKEHKQADANVFITEINRDYWKYDESDSVVIEHGIMSDIFKPDPNIERKPVILHMCNDFKNRSWACGYDIWERVTKDLPVKLWGDTQGISVATDSLEHTVKEFQSAQIYFNCAPFSPIPMTTLEAMSCECAILTTPNGLIGEIIEHGINGLISNDENTLRKYAKQLLNEPDLCRYLGANARKTILERFSIDRFVNQWNDLLWKTVEGYR